VLVEALPSCEVLVPKSAFVLLKAAIASWLMYRVLSGIPECVCMCVCVCVYVYMSVCVCVCVCMCVQPLLRGLCTVC